jgi:hypothetical protein
MSARYQELVRPADSREAKSLVFATGNFKSE